jgi:hypothetical protein
VEEPVFRSQKLGRPQTSRRDRRARYRGSPASPDWQRWRARGRARRAWCQHPRGGRAGGEPETPSVSSNDRGPVSKRSHPSRGLRGVIGGQGPGVTPRSPNVQNMSHDSKPLPAVLRDHGLGVPPQGGGVCLRHPADRDSRQRHAPSLSHPLGLSDHPVSTTHSSAGGVLTRGSPHSMYPPCRYRGRTAVPRSGRSVVPFNGSTMC